MRSPSIPTCLNIYKWITPLLLTTIYQYAPPPPKVHLLSTHTQDFSLDALTQDSSHKMSWSSQKHNLDLRTYEFGLCSSFANSHCHIWYEPSYFMLYKHWNESATEGHMENFPEPQSSDNIAFHMQFQTWMSLLPADATQFQCTQLFYRCNILY